MTRIKTTLATLLLATLTSVAFAQHTGHGGTSSGGGFGNTGNDSSMRDFKRALMLQATADQRASFAKCMDATEKVRQAANHMVGPNSRWSYEANAFSGQKEQFQAALAEMGEAHQHFRHSLSQGQEKELGKYFKKLDRYQAELGSRIAQVDRELSTNKPDPRRLENDSRKIEDVTEKWLSEHLKIAKEIGIGG